MSVTSFYQKSKLCNLANRVFSAHVSTLINIGPTTMVIVDCARDGQQITQSPVHRPLPTRLVIGALINPALCSAGVRTGQSSLSHPLGEFEPTILSIRTSRQQYGWKPRDIERQNRSHSGVEAMSEQKL